jgi:DNA-binding transcriptional MerR regulator
MSTAPAKQGARPPVDQPPRLLTIGAVCRRLKSEYPDISISKIRYLEDQGLLAPRPTQGGYRLFREEDVERLQTILQLQRDEFLPLRVIREELAAAGAKERARRRAVGLLEPEEDVAADDLQERAGISGDLVRELEEFGLLAARIDAGERRYGESDLEIATVCGRLAQFGIAPRHLRAFRTAAERNAGLLETIVTPALRSRNPERRRAGMEDLQALAALAQELSQLLFWRELRRQAAL